MSDKSVSTICWTLIVCVFLCCWTSCYNQEQLLKHAPKPPVKKVDESF